MGDRENRSKSLPPMAQIGTLKVLGKMLGDVILQALLWRFVAGSCPRCHMSHDVWARALPQPSLFEREAGSAKMKCCNHTALEHSTKPSGPPTLENVRLHCKFAA